MLCLDSIVLWNGLKIPRHDAYEHFGTRFVSACRSWQSNPNRTLRIDLLQVTFH